MGGRRFLNKLVSTLVVVSILTVIFARAAAGQGPAQTDLDISYSDGGLSVVEAKITDKVVNADGSISANLTLISRAAPTYGLLLNVEQGTVTGPALDRFLNITSSSIPFVGKRELDIGNVTFDPNSELRLRLGKWGVLDDEVMYIGWFDLCTAITLFTGTGYLPTTTDQLVDGLIDATLSALTEIANYGFDTAIIVAQLYRGDIRGAFETVGSLMTELPQVFANFFQEAWDILVSPQAVQSLGTYLKYGLPLISLIPLIYDLIVKPRDVEVTIRSVGPASGTENVDVVLVIDRSGSMDGQPITDAKNAAGLFVNLMRNGDKIGVVSFSSSASLDFPLTTVDSFVQQQAIAAINSIIAGGLTSIGAGLQMGQSELTVSGDPNHPHAMILLSDGGENTPPYVADILPDIISAGTRVYTVGLGDQVDEDLLQSIAQQTGGIYTFAPSSADLAGIYGHLSGQLSGQQQFGSGLSMTEPNGTDTQLVQVDGREATFAISWDQVVGNMGESAGALDLILMSPGGLIIDPIVAANDPDINYVETEFYEFYRLISPEQGLWELQVTNTTSSGVDYEYLVTGLSELKLNATLNTDLVLPTESVSIRAMVHNNEGVVVGADVTATIEPLGTMVTLYDDGSSGDDLANDGIYGGFFETPDANATYSIEIHALIGNQTREANLTLLVSDQAVSIVDLWIVGSGPAVVPPGELLTYEFIYGNSGPNSALSGEIHYALPEGASFITSTLGTPTFMSDDLLSWQIESVNALNDQDFSITTSLSPSAPVTVTSRITLTSSVIVSDTVPDNNYYVLTARSNTPTSVDFSGIEGAGIDGNLWLFGLFGAFICSVFVYLWRRRIIERNRLGSR